MDYRAWCFQVCAGSTLLEGLVALGHCRGSRELAVTSFRWSVSGLQGWSRSMRLGDFAVASGCQRLIEKLA